MKLEHRFRVRASQERVAHFHASAASLRAITPMPMTVQQAPPVLGSGSEIRFTLWMGPLPLRWHARVDNASVEGFDDVQLSGPFEAWHHRHNFIRVDEATTEVYDVVEAALPRGLLRRAFAWLMWATMPLLFAYRGWRTRALLQREVA